MIARYRGGRIVGPNGNGRPFDADALRAELTRLFDVYDLTRALDAIWQFVRELNRYVEERKPWELAKDERRAADLDRVLYDLADGLVAVAVALAAYLPETAPRILAALRQPADLGLARIANGSALATEGIEPAPPLFPRIEVPPAAAAAS
jgi:methionyl-tRNA synthetase